MAKAEISYVSDWDEFVNRGHYGWLRPERSYDERVEVIVPDGLSYSDYSGSLIEVSNSRKWKELFADEEDVVWTRTAGSHGTSAIVILASAITPEMQEVWNALSEYPLIDDEDHSSLEIETQGEEWARSVEEDFKRAIHKKLEDEDETLLDAFSTDQIYELFEFFRERANIYWENNQGQSMYIDVGRIVDRASERSIRSALKALSEGVPLS